MLWGMSDQELLQSPLPIFSLSLFETLITTVQSQAKQIQSQLEQIQGQAEQIAALHKTIDELKDEISRLNNTPKRPKFRGGGMEPRNRTKGNRQNRNSSANIEQQPTDINPGKTREEKRISPKEIPQGSRFKGYQEFAVQEVELHAKEIIYKLEVWEGPDGTIHRGKLPSELDGQHFGPELRTLVINLYAQGVTEPCILEFLHGVGIEISSGQIHNILMAQSEYFSLLGEEILSVGLEMASYIQVDDTGAKHKHKNGYCTFIGGEHFAYYKSSESKSRQNFLDILLQGKEGYYVNDAMIWHLCESGVGDEILYLFEEHQGKKYTSKKGFNRLLASLSIEGKKLRNQCFEAATVGFISESILRDNQVLVSDRAKQFAILNHGACWIHMERPLRKIPVTNETMEKELKGVREAIWVAYRQLKETASTGIGREVVEALYDDIISKRSMSPQIMEVIRNFRIYRSEMLKALDYPGTPAHNNGSEQCIREMVKRRDISGSTKSEEGRKFRDGLATLRQTCKKLGVSCYHFVLQHIHGKPPDLAEMVRMRYAASG
jgi:hypothetical protein